MIKNSSLISIVIVNYNCTAKANNCIRSIMNSSIDFKKLEIIFIDNASSDIDSLDAEFINNINITTVLNEQNLGVSSARNLGILMSKGEYICFLDSDDLFLPEKLEKQLEFLEKNKEYFLVCSNYVRYYKDHNMTGNKGLRIKSQEILYSDLSQTNSIVLSSTMCVSNKDVLHFDKGPREDYKLWLKILKKGHRIWYMDEIFIKYYMPNKFIFLKKKLPKLTEQWRVQKKTANGNLKAGLNFSIYLINAIIKNWRL